MISKGVVYNKLDMRIKAILLSTNGWLVGGAISAIEKKEEPSDYDIIVPNRDLYRKMVVQLTSFYPFKINTYGGLKVQIDDITLDIWCEELSHFIDTANDLSHLYNHKKCILLSLG